MHLSSPTRVLPAETGDPLVFNVAPLSHLYYLILGPTLPIAFSSDGNSITVAGLEPDMPPVFVRVT
jgi:hypothetical protein